MLWKTYSTKYLKLWKSIYSKTKSPETHDRYDKLQPDYKDDEISIEDRSIPDNATTKSLEALGATINCIDIWLKLFLDNYNARCDAYINAMK